ncbi:MAG: nucleoside triphosphate pyrophosphohydrolase [Rhodobiaceae bacterium]|nr:nucleoside triphosphate pyrophosphohydrolase [Rhodobiaceae bacterium]MCC0052892.1 nucleoside triphosphate pyrophosphohydrolase [Rhodobiaceae bacterium]
MVRHIDKLLAVMARLRDPETGCPWDVQQDFASIAPYTIEEAYEVADAIERGDMSDLKDELGDLLLQVVFHARMAEESGFFDFDDVAEAIHDKMVRRHPHVFGETKAARAADVRTSWEDIKAAERFEKANRVLSALDDVPVAFPALMRAQKLQKRAARCGFDWPDVAGARRKLDEELGEIDDAIIGNGDIAEEVGDALFALVNVARKLGVDVEDALRATNAKFVSRFRAIEHGLAARGTSLDEASLEEMDALWNAAKARSRSGG